MEERSIDDLEAPLTFCLHLNPNIVISRTIWIRHFIRTKYGPKLNQENQAKHLVNMDQYSISTKTSYRPKLHIDQNSISTKTRQIKRRESSETFSLVELCNFGTLRPQLIRDRIVVGIRDNICLKSFSTF